MGKLLRQVTQSNNKAPATKLEGANQLTHPDEPDLTGSAALSIQTLEKQLLIPPRKHSKTTYMTATELAQLKKRMSTKDPLQKLSSNLSNQTASKAYSVF